MSIFFSPPVRTYSILVPHHQACEIVDRLISTGFIEFEMKPYDDSSDPYYLIYSRIKQLKFKLNQAVTAIETKYKETVPALLPQEKRTTIGRMKEYIQDSNLDYLRYLDAEQGIVNDKLKRFNSMMNNFDALTSSQAHLQQQIDTLRVKRQIVSKEFLTQEFVIITGMCPITEKAIIERIIFRKTKGHSYVLFKDRPSEIEGSGCRKEVFICLMSKAVHKHLGSKIANLLQCNKVNLYELPNLDSHLQSYEKTLIARHQEYQKLMAISGQQLSRVLHQSISGQESSLQHHLVRLAFLQRMVYIICHSKQIGEPSNHILFTVHAPAHQPMPTLSVPTIPLISHSLKPRTIMPRLPCLTEVNVLTQLYSTPRHNQILPSVFMFATVPILFGMMFSDVGHGMMLLGIAFFMKLNPLFYFMAGMSIYCGIIYNQFFGMKIIRCQNLGILQPVWGVADNGLNFQNSLKMKLAMIIAFIHMTFGMCLRIVNEFKRNQRTLIIYDSLPKLVLLICTVGYLVLLIIVKWLTNYKGKQAYAPSIINSVLQLYLRRNHERKVSILGSMEFQIALGTLLNYICLLCIGVMLYNHTIRHRIDNFFVKTNKKSQKRSQSSKYQQLQEEDIDNQISQEFQESRKISSQRLSSQESNYYHEAAPEQNQLGVLQIFEYILSLISSTTSYLRLFALSLAHAKLSHLLLTFLVGTLKGYEPQMSTLRCLVFFMVTCGMMLALDVMECMMHVVRLHWVEWMGKFYTGCGVLFKPEKQEEYC